jgi:homoserine kinase type II
MAVYTVLGAEELAAALAAYGLPAPDRVRAEPRGGVNTNHHVWTAGRRFFLRLNEGKSDEEVLFEAEVLRFLAEARFPVPPLLLASDGRPFTALAGRQAMLFAYAAGEEATGAAVTAARCQRIGEQLARLHDLAGAFPRERPNPFGPERVAGWLAALRPDGAGDAEIRAALPLLERELARAAELPGAPRGLIHGDLFQDNVLWIGERVSAVLDWEMACTDPFAYDVGVALSAWCYGDRYERDRCAALLAGYRSRRPAVETLEALYPWTRFAALRFAASRIHGYRLAALGADRLVRKDWRRYRDRLGALVEMGERGFRELVGI